ncbi:MAG: Asp-tRNA(Asn)/Glu-tRNA(Gln) amidotransferase subunit GatC [Granulosicoccus sp.]|nr:Asp-tRNA(Asn)/Glu-tRNA(Gln) amidotransferase subunit GatC [Granulosicoccus sp.]
MALTPDDVKSIAHLARLGVDDNKLESYATEISNILGLVEQMNAVDTTNVEPMAHPAHAVQRLRDDEVTESNQREQLQRGAPAVDRGLFLVPKVIE